MAKKIEKTNVMRVFDQKKISYKEYTYDPEAAVAGTEVAAALGQDANHVFKTLVTVAASKKYYVFMVPVAEELDLKKAARAVKEKNIEMIKQAELLPLTGYVHGGCSPVGMKKVFPTVIHNTAASFDTIIFSGGKRGYQVECSLEDLKKIVRVDEADIIVDKS